MKALMEEGLPEPQLHGTFDGGAHVAEVRASFSARTTTWRDVQQAAAAMAEVAPPPGSAAAKADLRPAQERLRSLLAHGSLTWNLPAEATAGQGALEQAWDVVHLDPECSAKNAALLDALVALLFEFPHSLLVVHVEAPIGTAAMPALAAHFGMHAKREGRHVHDQLARRRGAAVAAALAQRGVPAARVSATVAGDRGAVHAEFDLRPLPAGPPAQVRKSTALLLEGQKLARIQRQSAVLLGTQSGGGGVQRPQYASVTKPTSTSAAINTPDALFVGETYVLESVAAPALGVPRCAIEFTMPAHDEELELYLDRPTGDINVQLAYRKASTQHWSAPLALPPSATFRVRHATVGVVIPETRLDAGAEGGAHTLGDKAHVGLAVLRYALRSQLYVGETYTLEVLETAELHEASLEFSVDEGGNGAQTVQVLVDRKWRDVTVQLRHQPGAAGEGHELPAGISVSARHDVVGVETTSGVTATGGATATCHLQGAEALYVGQPYTFECEPGSGLTVVSHNQHVVAAGGQSNVIQLVVDRACGEIELRLANALAGSGHWAEGLPLPASVPFVVRDSAQRGTIKLRDVVGRAGARISGARCGLYVGSTYLLEIEATELLLPASIEFTVAEARSVVTLPVQRAVGPVTALLHTEFAGDARHWAEALPLPQVFSFRVVHKRLGAVVHEAEVRQSATARSNTERVELPMGRNLFVGEEYTIEAAYQAEELARRVRLHVARFMEGKMVHFNSAADVRDGDPMTQAWSVDITGDAFKLAMNQELLDGIARIMADNPTLTFRVHGETGTAANGTSLGLARHFGLHNTRDAKQVLDGLASNRAHACRDALIARGVDKARLVTSREGATGRIAVDFVPEGGAPDAASGLLRTASDFIVLKSRISAELRLHRATSDVAVVFRGMHPDSSHWSNHLRMPTGLRVALRHVALGIEVAAGVTAEGGCFFAGRGAIPGHEEYELSVERGPYTDAAEVRLQPPPGPHEAVLRVGWQARLVRFALVAVDKQPSQATKAAEGLGRVLAFTKENKVDFNGAGEGHNVEQAWSIDHLDATKRGKNWATIRGIAAILKEYPDLKCQLHSETGAADTAPLPLAEHLRLDYVSDVQQIMDLLAESRAKACLDALLASGVPAAQLYTTYKGRGGHLTVDFIPQVPQAAAAAAAGHDEREEVELMPLPAGIPFQVRHRASDQVIVGPLRTETGGLEVACPLPASAALFVAHDYVVEALAGPGTEPNAAAFHMPADLTDEDTLEVKLPIKRCRVSDVTLRCENAPPPKERAWASRLQLPPNVVYDVLDAERMVVSRGIVPDPQAGAPLNAYELTYGRSYLVRVPETLVLCEGAIEKPVKFEQATKHFVVPVGRKTNDVQLLVRTDKADTDHWAAALPLPRAFDVVVRHKALNEVVQQFAVEGHGSSRYQAPLERVQLLVGETYTVRVGVSGRLQVATALAEVAQFVEGKTVHFSGAQDDKQSVQASWSVDYAGDDAKRAMNSEVLDGVARILQRHPGVRMQVHSETGNADKAPEPLARHYGKNAKRDVQVLCDRLAENRAIACMDALIARGVAPSRLYTTYKSRTGSLRTDFIPHPPDTKDADGADFASGVVAALGEFTVQPEVVGEPVQQVSLVLAYATGELKVVLRNPQAGSSHLTPTLPPSRTPTLSRTPALSLSRTVTLTVTLSIP